MLDDGFQHLKLKRNLDIVLIDATNPFGNRALMPRGILREPVSALARAQVIVLTRVDLANNCDAIKDQVKKANPKALVVEAIHQPTGVVSLKDKKVSDTKILSGQKICSFSTIGNPDAFVGALEKLGAKVVKNFSFMDHHTYQENDIRAIAGYCRKENVQTLLTTQKDAVKLKSLAPLFDPEINVFYLDVKISVVQNEGKLLERINHLS